VRRAVQHDEVGGLPCKGWLLAARSLALVSFFHQLSGRSSVFLSPVPRDDNGKLRGLSGESVETSQRSAAHDDTNRLSRRQLERALFLCGLRVFARQNRLIGTDRLLLCRPPKVKARRFFQALFRSDCANVLSVVRALAIPGQSNARNLHQL